MFRTVARTASWNNVRGAVLSSTGQGDDVIHRHLLWFSPAVGTSAPICLLDSCPLIFTDASSVKHQRKAPQAIVFCLFRILFPPLSYVGFYRSLVPFIFLVRPLLDLLRGGYSLPFQRCANLVRIQFSPHAPVECIHAPHLFQVLHTVTPLGGIDTGPMRFCPRTLILVCLSVAHGFSILRGEGGNNARAL